MRFDSDSVIFGNASSPFLLNTQIKFNLNAFENSRVVEELKENLCVDDWLSGVDSEGEIEQEISSSSEIMSKGGFPLVKWGSNSNSPFES